MDIDILSLFPDYFESPFEQSLIKKALAKEIIRIRHVDIRDFALDKHRRVDDRTYGGGPGMVLMPEPLIGAIRSVKMAHSHVVYLSPQGSTLTAAKCLELSRHPHLILICGQYEGIDERVIEMEVDEEISIGDYVLPSGLAPALVLVEAVCRFIPGFIGNEHAARADSFEGDGLLDTPHYTRPPVFEGREVPEVLLNGDHREIERWRRNASVKKTLTSRPDLFFHAFAKRGEEEEGKAERELELPPLNIDTALFVDDVEKSVCFFQKTLGWKVGFQNEREAVMKCGKNSLSLKRGEKQTGTHILFTLSTTDRNYFDRCVLALNRSGKVVGKLEKIMGDLPSHQIAFRDHDGYNWVLRWDA